MANLEQCSQCGRLSIPGETVTISVSEYETLRSLAQKAKERRTLSKYRAVSSSAIARNPDIADFILEHTVTMTTSEVSRLAKSEFGKRAPSRSAIYRFLQKMKESGLV